VVNDDVVARAEERLDKLLWGKPEDAFSARELLFVIDLPALINEVKSLRVRLEEAHAEVATLKTNVKY
jgi:hypothetical protein